MIQCPRCKTSNNPVNTRCYRCNALLQPSPVSHTVAPAEAASPPPAPSVPPPLPSPSAAPLFPSSAVPTTTPPARPAPIPPAKTPRSARHSAQKPRTLSPRVAPPNDPSMRDLDIPTPPSPEWSKREVPFAFNPADMPSSDEDIFTSAQPVQAAPPSEPNLSKSSDGPQPPSRTSSPRVFVRNPSAPNIPSPVKPPAAPPTPPPQPPTSQPNTAAVSVQDSTISLDDHIEDDEEPTLVGPAPKAPSSSRTAPPSALGLLKRSARRMNFATTSSSSVPSAQPSSSPSAQPPKSAQIPPNPSAPPAPSPTPPSASPSQPTTPKPTPTPSVSISVLGTQQTFTLQHNRLIIGREDGDLLLTKDPHACAWHAIISQDEDGVFLKDMGSRNGVYVQLQRPHTLQDDDRFRIGRQVLTFSTSWNEPTPDPHDTPLLTSPPPTMEARLTAQHPNGSLSLLFPISDTKPTSIGSEHATLLFERDPDLQPTHARISPNSTPDGPTFTLQQAHPDSAIFTQIHGEYELKDQDTILIGSTKLRVYIPKNSP